MALTKAQRKAFIKKVAKAVEKYAPRYDIKVYSPIIAQAILESGWGESTLAAKYNNLFGLKCGTKWTGKSVNMQTQEEFTPGTITTIADNFRVYDTFDDGIKGYFDFIQLARYANLKGVDDPKKYCETIKADGYATDSSYVSSLMSIINEWNLTDYDPVVLVTPEKEVIDIAPERTADDYLAVWRSWVGKNEYDGSFRDIIDTYNSHLPRARGYAVQYNDEWCDTTVSAAAVKAGMVDLIGTECGCEEHVKIFKSKGIWIEDGSITPQPGDIIVFSWRTAAQPNNSYSDHIGVVAAVKNGIITTIEGNKNESVGYRSIPVGWGYIRGFARPKYGGSAKPHEEVGGQTLGGVTTGSGSGTIGKSPKWVGRVAADMLNVRTWAGTSYPNIKSAPALPGGSIVEVCDEILAANGMPWYYVRINGTIYGFVSAAYIVRA